MDDRDMDERDHDRLRDNVSAYVIGTLESADQAELEEHLRSCDTCARDVRWLQPAAGALLESVEPMEPSPELRARVMEEVRADAARRQPAARRSRGSFFGFLARPATALAAVVLLAGGIGAYLIADDGGGRTASYERRENPGNLIGATLEREGDTGTLKLTNLRQLEKGRVYQAWVQHGNVMEDSSLFAARQDGTATAAIPAEDLRGGDAVLVTVEPQGGSTAPTGDALVSVDVD